MTRLPHHSTIAARDAHLALPERPAAWLEHTLCLRTQQQRTHHTHVRCTCPCATSTPTTSMLRTAYCHHARALPVTPPTGRNLSSASLCPNALSPAAKYSMSLYCEPCTGSVGQQAKFNIEHNQHAYPPAVRRSLAPLPAQTETCGEHAHSTSAHHSHGTLPNTRVQGGHVQPHLGFAGVLLTPT